MPDAWDTSVLSRVGGAERHAPLLALHVGSRVPFAVPAPAIQEVVRGFALALAGDRRIVARFRWLGLLLADPLAEVVPFGSTAATLAGRLLAAAPHPPTGRRRDGTRARQRAAWALDVQIAACAFAGGYGVLTENVGDFAALRDEIARLVPGVPPLVVRDARQPGEAPDQPATGAASRPSTRST